MPLGALIGAYQEDDSGRVQALLPLAGRSLLDYQVRCAAAVGASPIVILVERVPLALNDSIERLREEGLAVVPVADGAEAASRFEPGTLVLLIADGIAPPVSLLADLAELPEPTVVTVADDGEHDMFERIDAEARWSGIALVDSRTLGSTAAMLGDWDLPSTLLRRALQDGANRVALDDPAGEPLHAGAGGDLAGFERRLLVASRGGRDDWASQLVLPIVEEFATEKLMESRVRPDWLVWAAVLLTLIAALAILRGWPGVGAGLLVAASPLDLIARRLAMLRLSPLPPRMLGQRLLWPASGAALLALGWATSGGELGWGGLVAAVAAAGFAEAARIERGAGSVPGSRWLVSRRNAILALVPFAIADAWAAYVLALALYSAISFFIVQHWHHRILHD